MLPSTNPLSDHHYFVRQSTVGSAGAGCAGSTAALPPQPIGCHPTTCRCIAPFARLPPAPAPTQRCLTLPPPTAQRYLTLSPHPSTNLRMPHHGLFNRRQPHNDTTANPKPDQPCQFTDTPLRHTGYPWAPHPHSTTQPPPFIFRPNPRSQNRSHCFLPPLGVP